MKKRVNFTIEEHVLEKLDKMAKDRGIDRSTMISVLIYDSYDLVDLRDSGIDVSNQLDLFAEQYEK